MADVGLTGPTRSTLYVDGSPLDDLIETYAYNRLASGATKWSAPSRFWSSKQRLSTDATREVVEVSMTSARPTNRVQFQVSNFPAKTKVQYHDGVDWVDVIDRTTGRPAIATVNKSIPAVVNAGVADASHVHPQHRGPGHWRTVEFTTRMFDARRVRLVLQRFQAPSGPVDPQGRAVAYSLAVRDLQVGYRVDSPADVPRQAQRTQIADDAEPFSGSKDLLGSPVGFALREYRMSDISWPQAQMVAGIPPEQRFDERQVWKCEPQPYPYCVVPVYADVRAADGSGQVFDTLDVDPTTSGVATNLYYSNSPVDFSQPVRASDGEFHAPVLRADDTVTGSADALVLQGTVTLSGAATQWDPAQPWWIGLSASAESDVGDGTVFNAQGVVIRWVSGAFSVTVNDTTWFMPTVTNDVTLIVSRAGDGRVSAVLSDGQTFIGPLAAVTPTLDHTMGFGGGDVVRLRNFVLKQQALDDETIAAFFADPISYLVKPSLNDAWADLTQNALLRIHPSFQTRPSGSNPLGIRGGPGDFFDTLEWVPIPRDYVLHKGLFEFEAVQAKFFKMEFTNLVAQPFSASRPIQRKVLLFPNAVRQGLRVRGLPGAVDADAGMAVNSGLGAGTWFTDQVNIAQRLAPGYNGYTPSEGVYSADPNTQNRLLGVSSLFGLLPWHQGDSAPRFVETCVHHYQVVDVTQVSKVAYFVGLNSLRFLRSNHANPDNTEAYSYTFHDTAGLDTDVSSWSIDTDQPGLYTTQEQSLTTSEVLRSVRNVRGVQFATVQTPPQQRLANPDFNGRYIIGWKPYGGDIQIRLAEDVGTDIGSMLRVDRAGGDLGSGPVSSDVTWDQMQSLYPTWDGIEGSAWDDITGANVEGTTDASGVTSVEFIDMPARGRVYASARIYSPNALAGALHLQIVGEDGQVLADERTADNTGQIIEFYASYTIGEGGLPPNVRSWDQVSHLGTMGAQSTWNTLEGQTWDDVEVIEQVGYSGRVTVRVVQEGVTGDTWYVDNISLWDDPIIWEFSNDDGATWIPGYDIRNNPNGVLLFPDIQGETLSPTDGTNLRWRCHGARAGLHVNALLIRPWYASVGKGLLTRDALNHGGVANSAYDQYPEVYDAPLFKQWNKPIPEGWWFGHRQWLLQRHVEDIPATTVARNLVPNPSGEGSYDGWTAVGGDVYADGGNT